MEEAYVEESVRVRLLLSGLSELEEHGLADFSLRRAAVGAQVSCAAPYRHFKDKDEYIKEIIKYVNSKWEMLSNHLEQIFSNDTKKLVVELCIANLRFWIANGNYRTAFTVALDSGVDFSLDRAVVSAVKSYGERKGLDTEKIKIKTYTVRALIAGSVMLAGKDEIDSIIYNARKIFESEFQ